MPKTPLLLLFALLFCLAGCESKADVSNPKTFDSAEVSFQYPGNWTVTSQAVEGGTEIQVETPGDAILIVLVMEPKIGAPLDAFAESMIEIRAEEFRAIMKSGGDLVEIGDTQSKEVSTAWAGGSRQAVQHNFDIVALGEKVPHVALFHAIESPTRDGFVMSQVASEDLPKVKPGFKLIWQSLNLK